MLVYFDVRGQQGMDFSNRRNIIMDHGFCQNIFVKDLFLKNTQLFDS